MELFLWLAVFLITFLYASVGHGGASGFLALMSFFMFEHKELSTTALVLNMLVSGISFLSYKSAGHFRPRLLLPFLSTSAPFSFLGGMLRVNATFYRYFLAVVLLYAALHLNLNVKSKEDDERVIKQKHFFCFSLLVGAAIGLVSGIIGIGGGIFLSVYLLMAHLSTTKECAAISASFIFVNSFAGLLGRAFTGRLALGSFVPYLFASFLGGLCGSYLGARHFSVPHLRKILALVLLLASFKLFVT